MGIKLVGMDVDGTLTDAGVYILNYCNSPTEMVKYNRRDGMGISLLKQAGIKAIVITGENCPVVEARCQKLEIPCTTGVRDKVQWLDKYLTELGISWSDFAYIGDDVNDLEVLKRAGFSACPNDAEEEVKKVATYICQRSGGRGCVREFIDKILWRPEELQKCEIKEPQRFKSIAVVKDKYVGQPGILVGTGPTADFLPEVKKKYPGAVMIGINRAIVLDDNFDFVFIDHHSGIKVLGREIKNTKYVCVPFFSRNELNFTSPDIKRNADKILFYSWVYEVFDILTAPIYPLNDICLYIQWGNAQSAIHFAKKLGVSELVIVGCDGGEVDGRMFAAKIEPSFKRTREKELQRREAKYNESKDKMAAIAQRLDLKIQFYTGV